MQEENQNREADDFSYKYIVQDTGTIYLGGRYTYSELMQNEAVNFKIKSIIEIYLAREIDLSTSLESHFYYMKPEDFSARTFEQLRAKVKVSEKQKKKNIFGKEKEKYTDKTYKLMEFTALSEKEKKARGILIQEIGLSKLGLMSFSI